MRLGKQPSAYSNKISLFYEKEVETRAGKVRNGSRVLVPSAAGTDMQQSGLVLAPLAFGVKYGNRRQCLSRGAGVLRDSRELPVLLLSAGERSLGFAQPNHSP